MPAIIPMLELADLILEVGGHDLQICMQCGTCASVCPWPTVKEFSPRHLIRLASLGIEGYEQEDLWNCVTCNTCVIRCPRGVDLIDVMRATSSLLDGSLGTIALSPESSSLVAAFSWSSRRPALRLAESGP